MLHTGSTALSPALTPGLALKTVWQIDADPSYDIRWALPSATETVLVRTLDGSGTIHLADKSAFPLSPSTVLLLRKSTIRHYLCTARRWRFWWLEFDLADSGPLPLCTTMKIQPLRNEEPRFRETLILIRMNHPRPCLVASAHAQLLLAEYLNRYPKPRSSTPTHRERIEKAVVLMHEHLEGVGIPELAREACMSERRFRTVFAEVTGMSPKTFYSHLRLDAVKNTLLSGADKLETIAADFGFSSVAHLSFAFKKRFGVAPSKWARG